jgi:hypothetical protein
MGDERLLPARDGVGASALEDGVMYEKRILRCK